MKGTLGEPRDIYEREPDQGMETSIFLCVKTRDGTSGHLPQDRSPSACLSTWAPLSGGWERHGG